MLILNLYDVRDSDIEYTISKFPDGQQSIEISIGRLIDDTNLDVEIVSPMQSFKDVELIILANQAIREAKSNCNIELYVPYFLGARSDRKFLPGTSNYLKTVICPIINSQKFDKVKVLDPHSDVLEACLDNFVKISNGRFIASVFEAEYEDDNVVLVSPDAGALKKVFKIQKEYGVQHLIIGHKNRDPFTGEITHTSISGSTGDESKPQTHIIFDDICDGGRTFIELAKVLRRNTAHHDRIVLAVTHGLFTKGVDVVLEHVDAIYTTNSCQESINKIESENWSQVGIIDVL
jgi:ribose-phosphate pyrophosphokinase